MEELLQEFLRYIKSKSYVEPTVIFRCSNEHGTLITAPYPHEDTGTFKNRCRNIIELIDPNLILTCSSKKDPKYDLEIILYHYRTNSCRKLNHLRGHNFNEDWEEQ